MIYLAISVSENISQHFYCMRKVECFLKLFSNFPISFTGLLILFGNFSDELEKCLEELEEEHGTTQQLGDIYEKVELERNQLLEELDIAFEDLKDYMQRQVNTYIFYNISAAHI